MREHRIATTAEDWLDFRNNNEHHMLIIVTIVPFVVLQTCMVVFLARARRNDEMLRNGFFAILIAISLADCINMTTVDLLRNFAAC